MLEGMDLLRGDPQICVGAYARTVVLVWVVHKPAKAMRCSREQLLWG